jgi:hypothetical protein
MTSEQEAQLAELTQNWLNGNRGDVARELYKSPAMVARWCNYVSKMKGFEGDIETLANLLEFLEPSPGFLGKKVKITHKYADLDIGSQGVIVKEGENTFGVAFEGFMLHVFKDDVEFI